MSPQTVRSLYWLPGPALGVSLVALSVLGNAGPGFFVFSVLIGFTLLVVAPLIQLVLLALPRYRGRYGTVCALSLAGIFGAAAIPVFLGMFNFW